MTSTAQKTDWNLINNALSRAILDGRRLEELLDDLGCRRRGRSGFGKIRLTCPVHDGDGYNVLVLTDGFELGVTRLPLCCN